MVEIILIHHMAVLTKLHKYYEIFLFADPQQTLKLVLGTTAIGMLFMICTYNFWLCKN